MAVVRRRAFLWAGVAITGSALLTGCGPVEPLGRRPARAARLGILDVRARSPYVDAFVQELRDLGHVEGQNLTIAYRGAASEPQLPAVAAELVRLRPDVIATAGGAPSALAAKQATATIPIVAVAVGDPVAIGLVDSLARPSGNVTGLASLAPELAGKRLELLKEAFPGIARVAVVWNPALADKQHQFQQTAAAAAVLGLSLESLEVRAPGDFTGAFAAADSARVHALLTLGDPLTSSQLGRIAEFSARGRLPAMYEIKDLAVAGGLMAYGPNASDFLRRAATQVDKILNGARPADLPIEYPTAFDFVINLRTARALGLTIPSSVLQQATEVLE